jgi:dCTP deaminase
MGTQSTITKEGEDTREAIDLTRKYKKDDDTNKYGPEEYWEIKEPSRKEDENYLEIDTEEFYILRSKERFSLPDDIAVYCRAITEELGEIRIHYAGFVHPAFGSSKKRDDEGLNGAPLAFEVRGHNVKAILRDGETLARLKYYRMSQVGDPEDSADYGDQELKLSKVFKDWPE